MILFSPSPPPSVPTAAPPFSFAPQTFDPKAEEIYSYMQARAARLRAVFMGLLLTLAILLLRVCFFLLHFSRTLSFTCCSPLHLTLTPASSSSSSSVPPPTTRRSSPPSASFSHTALGRLDTCPAP